MRIVILEDNQERRDAMQACISDRFPYAKVEFFVAAKPMIRHLKQTRMFGVGLIALDNDLEMIDDGKGGLIDPGDGIQVAAWLATQPVTTPVVVHTTNMSAGRKITQLLSDAGFITERVVPYGDLEWIDEIWHQASRNLIVENAPEKTMASMGLAVISAYLSCKPEYELEQALDDLSLCAQWLLAGSSETVSIELMAFGEDENLLNIHSRNGVLSQVLNPYAVIEEVLTDLEKGTLLSAGNLLIDFLRHVAPVSHAMVDRVQVAPGLEAVILVCSFSQDVDLDSLAARSTLKSLKSAIEICMRADYKLNE